MFILIRIVKKQVQEICSFLYLLSFVALYICIALYSLVIHITFFVNSFLFFTMDEVKFNGFCTVYINESFERKYCIFSQLIYIQSHLTCIQSHFIYVQSRLIYVQSTCIYSISSYMYLVSYIYSV